MAASKGEHAHLAPGSIINNRYHVIKEIGCGNFSKVFACRDTTIPPNEPYSTVAVKLLKREYSHDAKFENDILAAVTNSDPARKEKVLRLLDHFYWNRFPCFVFERKGCPLRVCRLGVLGGHVSRDELRRLARQSFQALRFLHFHMKLVHTDLKPDNILLDDPHPYTEARPGMVINYGMQLPGIGNGWTIADFGSASFYRMDKLDTDLISTRPYRAPEVVLGNPWHYAADMWSIGCILYEVYTGHRLFDVNDDGTHLAMMEARLGKAPPAFTLSSRNGRRFFDGHGRLMRPLAAGRLATIRPIAEEVAADDPVFADLLLRLLSYEPNQRLRADDALRHPFVRAGGPNAAAIQALSATAASMTGSNTTAMVPASQYHQQSQASPLQGGGLPAVRQSSASPAETNMMPVMRGSSGGAVPHTGNTSSMMVEPSSADASGGGGGGGVMVVSRGSGGVGGNGSGAIAATPSHVRRSEGTPVRYSQPGAPQQYVVDQSGGGKRVPTNTILLNANGTPMSSAASAAVLRSATANNHPSQMYHPQQPQQCAPSPQQTPGQQALLMQQRPAAAAAAPAGSNTPSGHGLLVPSPAAAAVRGSNNQSPFPNFPLIQRSQMRNSNVVGKKEGAFDPASLPAAGKATNMYR